ncbi:MAG: polymer-forming cytoskeletal protein [Chloroflexaceae bacterium]|jgi:hypothetical protein|nr:polymer-forming cytoskeletal protein [Chloroflexaceae bacterium]
MRHWRLLLMMLLLLGLSACGTDGRSSLTLISEGSHTLQEGETLYGALVVLHGQIVVPLGSAVQGPFFVLGGTAVIDGLISGDVTLLDGTLRLGPHAHVEGNLEVGGGTLEQAPEASIDGATHTGVLLPAPAPGNQPGWLVLQSLGLALLAALLVRYLPRSLAHVGDAMVHHPIVAGAMGLLAGVVGVALLVLMAFTLILIPVVVTGLLLVGIAVAVGLVALGDALGQALTRWQGWRLRRTPAAMLGTLFVGLALALLQLLPQVGGSLSLVAALISFGAVILTRFGQQPFVPEEVDAAGAGGHPREHHHSHPQPAAAPPPGKSGPAAGW